jgi:hypothetical protein
MPPAYVFDDNLQSYSPGTGYPTGFHGTGLVFDNSFFNGSSSPTPSPVGFYENAGIVFAFDGDALTFPDNSDLGTEHTSNTTVAWWALGQDPQFPPGGLQLFSVNPSTLVPQTVLQVSFESDNSVSLIAPGFPKVNSLFQVFDYFTWTFFSLSAAFSKGVSHGVSVLAMNIDMYVNGVAIFTNVSIVTSIPISSLWDLLPTINQWNFTTAYYGYLAATSDIQPLPFYPAPAATINAKSPQLIAEFANLPAPPKADAAQLIVEIAIAGFIPGGVFPEYIKSRHRAGH